MFTVLLAFIIFLAMESFERAKTGAGVEAVAVTKLHSTAALFHPPSSDRLQGGLVCYARAVIEDGWPAMRQERYSERVQFWVDELAREFAIADPRGAQEEAAYGSGSTRRRSAATADARASPRHPRSYRSRCGSCW